MLVLFACITGFDQHQAPNTLDVAAAHGAWHLQEQQANTDVGETPAILSLTVLNATKHPDARCADGSPGAYYHTKSTRQGRYKWVFELSGGATCGDGKSCSEDLEKIYSTKQQNLPQLMNPEAYSIMNDAPMRAWNRVIPMYCSMDFWLEVAPKQRARHSAYTSAAERCLREFSAISTPFMASRRPTKYSSRACRADRLEWLTTLIGWPHATRMRALLA